MDNVRPEGTEDQYVRSPIGEAWESNFCVGRYKNIRKHTQRYNQGFGAAREQTNDAVASIVYMIHDGDINSNVDTNDIMSLMAEWDAENCMDTSSTSHTRECYVLKYKIHDPDTQTYMEALSGENAEKHFKAIYDKIKSLMRRYTWEIFKRK